MVFDRGGTLRPGCNPLYNETGLPEPLVPPRAGGKIEVSLSFPPSFATANGLTSQQVANIRATVKKLGATGPDAVERAFGAR